MFLSFFSSLISGRPFWYCPFLSYFYAFPFLLLPSILPFFASHNFHFLPPSFLSFLCPSIHYLLLLFFLIPSPFCVFLALHFLILTLLYFLSFLALLSSLRFFLSSPFSFLSYHFKLFSLNRSSDLVMHPVPEIMSFYTGTRSKAKETEMYTEATRSSETKLLCCLN